jgi:hypothetical protein
MQPGKKYLRAAISLLVGLPLAFGSCGGARRASAQTAPTCPPGYYCASDGYCYPTQPPPVYAAPPPVYEMSPPVYQPAPVVDGLAIGVGVGLLFGALAGGGHGGDRGRGGDVHGGRGGGDHGHR